MNRPPCAERIETKACKHSMEITSSCARCFIGIVKILDEFMETIIDTGGARSVMLLKVALSKYPHLRAYNTWVRCLNKSAPDYL